MSKTIDTLRRVESELTRLSDELGDWDATEQKTLDDVRELISQHADKLATAKVVRWPDSRIFTNGQHVTHTTTGRTGRIDGVLSNCPKAYCVDFGGPLNEYIEESALAACGEK